MQLFMIAHESQAPPRMIMLCRMQTSLAQTMTMMHGTLLAAGRVPFA